MRIATAALFATVVVAGQPPALRAQVQLTIATDGRARPGGPVVASLMPGARVTLGSASGAETQVTLEGWVDASRLGARRDSFPASVSGRLTLRVRSQPSARGAIVAVLQPGAGVHTLARQGTWTRVRRTLWASTASVQRRAASTANGAGTTAPAVDAKAGAKASVPATQPRGTLAVPTPDSVPPSAEPAAQPGRRGRGPASVAIVASDGARVRDLPEGRILGVIQPGSSVDIIGRQPGLVRVRLDGWVSERDLISGDTTARPDVTAAELRADPNGMKGRVVQWQVEVMSLQVADPLRVELARDEPYLLARGPGIENAILYLAVPPALLAEARTLPPLAKVYITARVRSGRSEPAGTPILDLLSIARR